MRNRWLPWLTAGLLSAPAAHAVDEDTGVQKQYQFTGTLDGALNKRTDWRASEILYLNGNHVLYTYATQAGLTWAATPWLSLAAAYRMSRVEVGDSTWTRHRLVASGAVGMRARKWRLGYKLYWQGDWRDPGEGGIRHRAYLRNQVQLKYAGFERFQPYVAVEIWNRVDPNRTTSGMDRIRYTLGTDVEMSPHQSVGMYARKQFYGNNDPSLYVFSLEYAYKL
jgi:hypothetical protein